MVAALVLTLLISKSSPQPECDTGLIWKTLRQIEIADYQASATPPPPAIAAELYALTAETVAKCAEGTRHFADSKVRDLLEAGSLATLSGQAYFKAQNPPQGCTALHEAERYYTAAYAARATSRWDTLALQADKPHVASLREFLSSKCRGS
jgi:hypothetical protein